MGQVLLEDKIGALSHSSGVITLQASRLTIGGQQYVTTANTTRTIATDVTLAANTLYMIFAVQSGGVVSLRISSNFNSTGPAGFTSWKLVGAFYSNGRSPVAFGAFVTTKGVPTSDVFGHTPVITALGGGASVGTIIVHDLFVKRVGDTCFATWVFRQGAAGIAGTGNYKASLPFTVDTNKAKTGVGTVQGNQGSARLNTAVAGGEYGGYVYLVDSTGFGMFLHDESTGPTVWDAGFGALTNVNMDAAASFDFPVQGWTNTPLEDL